jgi:hypothetical protein
MGNRPSLSSEGMFTAMQTVLAGQRDVVRWYDKPGAKNLAYPVLNRDAPVYAVVNKGQ